MADRWYKKASVQTAFVSGVFLIIATLVVEFSPKARLERQLASLESQLAPFRALALERFGGTEQQALAKLATQFSELEAQFKREAGRIRRFDVTAVARLDGKWKSATPPDFSHYFRTAGRGVDVRVQLKTKNQDMRWIDFVEATPPRIAAGEGTIWLLDYTAQAPPGSWVLGLNRDDLEKCGTMEMTLYGIDSDVAEDAMITVDNVTLAFFINGVAACQCDFHAKLTAQLTKEQGSPVRVQLNGPVAVEPVP